MKRNTSKPTETFELRFVGRDIRPEEIPLRLVTDALTAVQDIAAGRDPFTTRKVPLEKAIGLTKIRRGSAIYACVARDPTEAIGNLERVGALLTESSETTVDDQLVAALSPIEQLSSIARNTECVIEVRRSGKHADNMLFTINADDYRRISERVFLEGDTTIIGKVIRVGGATDMRCLMRISSRRKLLYCNVRQADLVRRLGQCLYQEISAIGTAVWIHSSWRLHKFEIRDFSQPRLGDVNQAVEDLRSSGLKAWDEIADPASYIQEMR